jgi:hypothetical protein
MMARGIDRNVSREVSEDCRRDDNILDENLRMLLFLDHF